MGPTPLSMAGKREEVTKSSSPRGAQARRRVANGRPACVAAGGGGRWVEGALDNMPRLFADGCSKLRLGSPGISAAFQPSKS
jgi:hypothetical protein